MMNLAVYHATSLLYTDECNATATGHCGVVYRVCLQLPTDRFLAHGSRTCCKEYPW